MSVTAIEYPTCIPPHRFIILFFHTAQQAFIIDNTNSGGVDVDTNMNIKSVYIISKYGVVVDGIPKSLKAISLNAFCVMNGTVDSRTKETKAHRAKEFITSQPE